MAKRIYKVMVESRTFRLCDFKEEAIEYAKLVFDTGYDNVWIAYGNNNRVPKTPVFKRTMLPK